MSTRAIDLDDKEILIHQELLGSSDSNPINSNDKETPNHRGPLGILTTSSLEQVTSLPIISEIVAFDGKGQPISGQKRT